MLKRRILILSGLLFLFSSLCLVNNVFANVSEVKSGVQNHALKPRQVLAIPKKSADVSPNKAKSRSKASSYYTVKRGDTLGKIARKTSIPVKRIMALNNVRPSSLRIGRKLVLSKPVGNSTQKESVTDDTEEEEEDITENINLTELEKEKKKNEELLGKWNSPDERKLFIKVATGFLGAPYRFGGSTLRGIDCSAYVRKMYEFFDVTLPRTAREQSTVGVTIEKEELEEGDLIFFQTRRPIGHVGIYIGNNEFVHASYKGKVVRIDSLDMPYFQKRFRRAVRVKGLDNNNKGA
jgi:LysM repeat protein